MDSALTAAHLLVQFSLGHQLSLSQFDRVISIGIETIPLTFKEVIKDLWEQRLCNLIMSHAGSNKQHFTQLASPSTWYLRLLSTRLSKNMPFDLESVWLAPKCTWNSLGGCNWSFLHHYMEDVCIKQTWLYTIRLNKQGGTYHFSISLDSWVKLNSNNNLRLKWVGRPKCWHGEHSVRLRTVSSLIARAVLTAT